MDILCCISAGHRLTVLLPLQANSILSSLQSEDLQNKPALLATQATLLEASKQERAALDLFSQVQASQLADKQMSKAEKAALNKGVLPIISRLQLKVNTPRS